MKSDNIFTQKVNFYISIAFIAMFGIFTTTMTLKVLALEDPIANAIVASVPASLAQ